MRSNLFHPGRSRRGYGSIIGLLIVIVIIMIIAKAGYFTKDPVTNMTQAKTYIKKSEGSACFLNMNAVRTNLQQATIGNSGELPDANILRARLGNIRCPDGGIYQVDTKGELYCTKHSPAPDAVTASVVNLY